MASSLHIARFTIMLLRVSSVKWHLIHGGRGGGAVY